MKGGTLLTNPTLQHDLPDLQEVYSQEGSRGSVTEEEEGGDNRSQNMEGLQGPQPTPPDPC